MEIYIGKCNHCPYVVAAEDLTLLRQAIGAHIRGSFSEEATETEVVHEVAEFGPVDLLQYPSSVSHTHVYLASSPQTLPPVYRVARYGIGL